MQIKEKISRLLEEEKIESAQKILDSASLRKAGNWVYFYKGEILRMKGFFKKAVDNYFKFFSSNPEKNEKLACMIKLASCFRTMGIKEEAIRYSKMAIEEDPHNPDALLEAAMSFRLAGDRKKAETIFNSLEKMYMKEKDFSGLSYIWWAMGGMNRTYGDLGKSVKCFKKALYFASKARDRSLMVYALFGLAGAMRIKGDINASIEAYKKAAGYASRNDTFARAYSFCGLANGLRQKGELSKALALYKKSGKLYLSMGDAPDLGFVNWGMGEIYKKRGELKKALEKFKEAYMLFKKGEKRGEILSMFSMAQILYVLGKKEEADKMYFSGLDEARRENFKTYLEIFT